MMETLILDRPSMACLGLRRCTLELPDAELCAPECGEAGQPRATCFSAWIGPTICCGIASRDAEGQPLVRGTWQGYFTGPFQLDASWPEVTVTDGRLQVRLRLEAARGQLFGRVEGRRRKGEGILPGPWISLADV